MRSIKNLYRELSTLISEHEIDGRTVIKADDIVDDIRHRVDTASADREWLVNQVLKQAAAIVLYQHGFRSVIKSKGYYVNLKECETPAVLIKLFNNEKDVEKEKLVSLNEIMKYMNNVIPGQLNWAPDGTVYETVSEKELLAMLENIIERET